MLLFHFNNQCLLQNIKKMNILLKNSPHLYKGQWCLYFFPLCSFFFHFILNKCLSFINYRIKNIILSYITPWKCRGILSEKHFLSLICQKVLPTHNRSSPVRQKQLHNSVRHHHSPIILLCQQLALNLPEEQHAFSGIHLQKCRSINYWCACLLDGKTSVQ